MTETVFDATSGILRTPLEWSPADHYLLWTAEEMEGRLTPGTAGCWQDYCQSTG